MAEIERSPDKDTSNGVEVTAQVLLCADEELSRHVYIFGVISLPDARGVITFGVISQPDA